MQRIMDSIGGYHYRLGLIEGYSTSNSKLNSKPQTLYPKTSCLKACSTPEALEPKPYAWPSDVLNWVAVNELKLSYRNGYIHSN